ncbi:hypothetical protein LSUE1_G005089 [Lachnellula suecica]|uniref:Uncharacterized protein n=1 Tax=Lachnellula suecica TaxID=602035 RepID=A0A8T9CDW0_9HELO|nr:hypothetical protein LSUE1_G005089 [Lachnellula suecica]
MYDPLTLMNILRIPSETAVRTIAFLLVLINGYDLLGALQNNPAVIWYSIAARLMGALFFWRCGSPWDKLVAIELETTGLLLGAIFVGRVAEAYSYY